jgi:peptidoglycan/LPS O-acetylase OafA/YrhL
LGAYLLFPLLYGWIKDNPNWKRCLSLLLIAIGIELFYRAVAIYWLDGSPISYEGQRFLPFFPKLPEPLDQNTDQFFGFFQQRAPFGFIFSRIGEFVLGMILAVALFKDRNRVNKRLLNFPMGLVGVLIWLVGQGLLYVGLWGWIFSDFFIALGLILWTFNLAYLLQKISASVFYAMTFLGTWSYYIYLVHQPFTRGARGIVLLVIDPDDLVSDVLANVLCLGLAVICTVIASFLLMKFNKSPLADLMFTRIGRLMGVNIRSREYSS